MTSLPPHTCRPLSYPCSHFGYVIPAIIITVLDHNLGYLDVLVTAAVGVTGMEHVYAVLTKPRAIYEGRSINLFLIIARFNSAYLTGIKSLFACLTNLVIWRAHMAHTKHMLFPHSFRLGTGD